MNEPEYTETQRLDADHLMAGEIKPADPLFHIPGQEIHRPSRNRGQTPTFIPFDDSFLSGESTHQNMEPSDIGGGLSWMDTRGRIGSAMEFLPGDEPNVNSEYASSLSPLRDDRRWFDETKPFTHDEKAALFFLNHKPGRVAGLRLLAGALVAAPVQKVSNAIEIKANISIGSPDLELDADGNPTTLESAMALDAVDALCAAEDERWKKEIDEMEFDFSKESIVEMLNEELVAEGRDPFYSVQMLSAQAAAAVRKKQKARKKKRK